MTRKSLAFLFVSFACLLVLSALPPIQSALKSIVFPHVEKIDSWPMWWHDPRNPHTTSISGRLLDPVVPCTPGRISRALSCDALIAPRFAKGPRPSSLNVRGRRREEMADVYLHSYRHPLPNLARLRFFAPDKRRADYLAALRRTDGGGMNLHPSPASPTPLALKNSRKHM